jgi:hypothetical protein
MWLAQLRQWRGEHRCACRSGRSCHCSSLPSCPVKTQPYRRNQKILIHGARSTIRAVAERHAATLSAASSAWHLSLASAVSVSRTYDIALRYSQARAGRGVSPRGDRACGRCLKWSDELDVIDLMPSDGVVYRATESAERAPYEKGPDRRLGKGADQGLVNDVRGPSHCYSTGPFLH